MAVHVRPTLAPALVATRLLELLACSVAIAFGHVASRTSPEWQPISGHDLHLHEWHHGCYGFLRIRGRYYWCKLIRGLHSEWRCRSGQHLHTCTNGAAATGTTCTSVGDNVCASSNAGFTLNGCACQANACTGTSGNPATGASGMFDSDCIWASCSADFTLRL